MTRYYLIRNDNLVGNIDADAGDVVALPLFHSGEAMSLMNEQHALNLMANLSLTAPQVLAAMGLNDRRADLIKTVFVSPQIVSLTTVIDGPVYHLVDIGAYSLWQVDSNQANLIALHNELWAMAPTLTLGMLAVVQTFGTSFFQSAMRTAVGMTVAQALARRDRIATYLESLGKNATALRAATNEHTQMAGIVTALGYTMTQLWTAMVE
jgi:hypothetical protein